MMQISFEPKLIEAIIEALQPDFGTSIKLIDIQLLSEPDRRNKVARLFLSSDSQKISVIFKQSLSDNTQNTEEDEDIHARFVRDYCGLKFLNECNINHSIPKFYGVNHVLRFILIEDLGQDHISLVDSLTKSNPIEATSALIRFTKSLANFHISSFERLDKYDELLLSILPNRDTPEKHIKWHQNDLIPKFEWVCKKLNLTWTTQLEQEALSIIESVLSSVDFFVLTHGDICPDNVFDHREKNELQLIDFEWVMPGSALLDATYFRMGFPTCWCAKKLPENIIDMLEKLYRETIADKIKSSQDEHKFMQAYIDACGFWVLRSMLFVESILEKDECWSSGPVPVDSLWRPQENFVRPRLISRLEAFIKVAGKHNSRPNILIACEQILDKVSLLWPDAMSMKLYPAFMA